MSKLVFENDKAKFFETDLTKTLTQTCRTDFRGWKLEGHKVLMAHTHDGKLRQFVLINEKGEVIEATDSFSNMGTKID